MADRHGDMTEEKKEKLAEMAASRIADASYAMNDVKMNWRESAADPEKKNTLRNLCLATELALKAQLLHEKTLPPSNHNITDMLHKLELTLPDSQFQALGQLDGLYTPVRYSLNFQMPDADEMSFLVTNGVKFVEGARERIPKQ